MTTPFQLRAQDDHARLPEDLLNDILSSSGGLAHEVEALLGVNLDQQDELRRALLDLGYVHVLQESEIDTVCGIDGGFAVERTASVDILLSVAFGVEGLNPSTLHWDRPYEWWTRVRTHDPAADRICRGVMAAQELALLAAAPHSLRILDGSHLTPIIQLNSALTLRSREMTTEARQLWERLSTVDCLATMANHSGIVALPKYDSSRVIADNLGARLGYDIPGDDKFLMSLLLEPGEYTRPRQVEPNPWSRLHFNSPSSEHKELAKAMEDAIRPLKLRKLAFTYYKPDRFSPASRVEVKRDLSSGELNAALTTLRHQMTAPFIREPFPQYLADKMAKSVGLALSALQSSVQLALADSGRPELAELLIASHRTEGI